MSNVPNDRRYAVSHEWASTDGSGIVTVGITDHAQAALGDVVFVELPEIGTHLDAGDTAGVVESVKAASDVYSPVAGTVVAANGELAGTPELINQDCYGGGWLMRIRPASMAEYEAMLSADDYAAVLAAEGD
jgi:glycine cleavage system H protein